MENIIKYFKDNFEEKNIKNKAEELRQLIDWENDFYFEFGGAEFRLIIDYSIERIFEESCIELLKDCYFTKDNEFFQRYFDYDSYISDCEMAWYWEHFSSYDWSEEYFDEFYIFRTN